MLEPSYVLALTTGLLGGAHCVGMCGPIVASYSLQGVTNPSAELTAVRKVIPHLLYNVGRISTYAFIGALLGVTGTFIHRIAGFQNIIPLIAGVIMIVMGLNITGLFGDMGWLEKHSRLVTKAGQEVLRQQSLWKYYILGSLMGFLPCGLSYSVFMAAAGTGSLLSGFLLTLSFGIGTLPALLLFGVTASYISTRLRGFLYKGAGVIIVVMGIWFILKGINLYA
jgi:hypothetical protein